jgi:hypothetical protein
MLFFVALLSRDLSKNKSGCDMGFSIKIIFGVLNSNCFNATSKCVFGGVPITKTSEV